ncbi:dual oxidase 2-like isoform X2 [Ostrea edulis]|uniref:dual oxidase 2-like isoform X2 n=1 Tax=Ostrea edulis TaxID=37623 RepID=UPI0024AF4C21|nr:dual oxidase 2-like isoform X2 [Ostrea edulis]
MSRSPCRRTMDVSYKRLLLFFGVLIILLDSGYPQHEEEFEPIPQDGFFNNLNHPDWGAVDDILIRKSPPDYQDGVYEPAGQDRPNPFHISDTAHSGESGLPSQRGRTAMLVFFGQQIVEEILDVQRPGCPREFFNIPVPKDHRFNPNNLDNLQMPLQRSRFNQRTGQTAGNPRQQLNEITPFIDGTLFYGPGKAWTDAIREFKHGYLKVRDPNTYDDIKSQFPANNDIRLPFANPPPPADHFLKPVSRFFRLGNPRGFENPFLLTFGVIWFRWHNFIAKKLAEENVAWRGNDERLFEEARRRVIAHYQKIVMYDWLPRWLHIDTTLEKFFEIPSYLRDPSENCTGRFCAFNGYDSEIHPGISQEFQTAAMRFGHTLVTPGIWIRGPTTGNQTRMAHQMDCNWKNLPIGIPNQPHRVHAIRLCNAYWNSREPVDNMLDDIIRGLSSTLAEKEDHIVVPDLREHLFGPLEFSRRDLVAINIQRGREHGLTDFNSVRKAFGLDAVDWSNLTTNRDIRPAVENLRNLYNNASNPNLDLFVGGLLETTDDGPGPLFRSILLDQFMRIRHGDRFWFENKGNGYFNDDEIQDIMNVTLHSIILNVTNVTENDIQEDVFIHRNYTDPCDQPNQLTADSNLMHDELFHIENCTSLQHYDYFSGSGAAFVLTFVGLGLCVPGAVGIMVCMAKIRAKKMQRGRQRRAPHRPNDDPNVFTAVEWVGPNSDERNVKVKFDRNRKKIHVEDTRRKPLRMLDLRMIKQKLHFRLSADGLQNVISVRVQGEIDLVLKFVDMEEREKFRKNLDNFLVDLQIERELHQDFDEKRIYENASTKEERQNYLDKFFRVICLQAFNKNPGQLQIEGISGDDLNRISKVQLTRTEFADALGLKPNSVFVRNMFMMVDKDNSGFVGFQEFLDMFVVLSSGDAEDKARLIFNMYDIKKQGKLSSRDFARMIQSMLDLSDQSISSTDMQALLSAMYKSANMPENSDIDFETFSKLFASDEYESTLRKATLGIEALGSEGKSDGKSAMARKRTTFFESYRKQNKENGTLQRRNTRVKIKTTIAELPKSVMGQRLYELTRKIENYRLQIFWLTLYILVTLGIFLERAFYYSFEREHAGLRRIAGYGVTVTRGAASVMMFTYSSLLVTMSRNTITFLRETFLHRFIPFDSAHAMHKIIAMIALLFTVVHCVGHGINLYHISTQASSDLNCIFREYFRATDVLASFQYWAFQTITGFTGILLTLIVIIIYVFATPYARKNLFNAFWITHSLYILLYIFTVMHGTGRLVQPPLFQNYFYGPLFIYVVDKFISLSRNQVEIDVLSADLLPSDVTALKFKRPINFEYRSGQWVRIACVALGKGEYHPFTLTSAPHEDYLSLHIRAVGPWTTNLRQTYDANKAGSEDWTPPKVLIDGPFGEGHQDWYKFPVAVLVGGGIGVTPFASILKDIVFKTAQPIRFPCQKVYFLWVTRTQKQFEWLTDIIREVEEKDKRDLVSVHIFITQFQQKFDLRTTMLYICERHFQKIAGKSLFTGLKAITHFGRPQFQEFLESLHREHPEAKQVGVFSCGPPPMTLNVDKACAEANKKEGLPAYSHHFENF